jgi:outer membrane protein
MRIRHIIPLLLLCGTAAAQKPASLTMSLDEALSVASRQQPDLQNAAANIRYAQASTKVARAGYLPQLTVESDMHYNVIVPTSILPGNALNPSGDPNKLTPIKFNTAWNSTAGLRLIQPIYDPSKLVAINNTKTAENLALAQEKRLKADREEEIASAWFANLLDRAKLLYATMDMERATGNATLIDDQLKNGKALENDLLDARLRVRTAAVEKNKIEQDIRTGQVNLSSLMGYDTLVLVNPSERLMDLPALRDSSWMHGSDAPDGADNRPELAEEKINLDIKTLELDSKKADRLPKLNFEGYLGANHFNSTFNPFQNWFGNSFLGLSLRWPLLKGGATRYEIDQAGIQAEQQGNAIRKLRQQFYYDMVNTRQALTYQWQLIQLQKERIAIREDRIALVRSRLQEGRAKPQDLLDEDTLLLQEQDALYRQLHDFLVARLAYNKARGRQTLQ